MKTFISFFLCLCLSFVCRAQFSDITQAIDCGDFSAARSAVRSLIEEVRSDSAGLSNLREAAEQLFMPGSPDYNYDAYRAIISELYSDTPPDDMAGQWLLEMISNNPVGTVAADFPFELRGGASGRLSDYFGAARPVVLIFYDPGCDDCSRSIEELHSALSAESICFVAVYSGDERSLWEESVKIPADWIDATDGGAADADELYFITRMPTIYLLNPDGVVVRADIEVSEVIKILEDTIAE